MKKTPTLFERDWNGDRSRVVNQVHAGCEWVMVGEGVATRKIDGTCCLVRDGKLFKRRELKPGEPSPPDFEVADTDEETGKTVGWVPVGDGPEDKWHQQAFRPPNFPYREDFAHPNFPDGTYELIGPKVQGNPEHVATHVLVRHATIERLDAPRTFEGLREWFADKDIEGIVFHHPDGRMAKIKLRDFGIKRRAKAA